MKPHDELERKSEPSTEVGVAPEPALSRIALVLTGALAIVGSLFLAAQLVADRPFAFPSLLVSLVAGVAAALLIGCLGEWAVHRYLMHRRSPLPLLHLAFDLHHRAHHWVHFPPDNYVRAGRVQYVPVFPPRLDEECQTTASRMATVASHALFYSFFAVTLGLLPAWYFTGNPVFTAVVACFLAALIFLFIHVHDAVHFPGHSWLERFDWFWFLDRHHYVHHIDNDANTNFLLPLGDLLLGTLRRELTDEELERWPSYEAARRTASEPLARRRESRERTTAAPSGRTS